MPYDLTNPFVIGISSRALFNLEQENSQINGGIMLSNRWGNSGEYYFNVADGRRCGGDQSNPKFYPNQKTVL